ncbi:hypothetical protein HDV06_004802 [Boothiomyces sp. JEL0866]|nr:hypothetical protein HDV06_004802 [Boothiomyces sp. JEL0866]
MDSTIYQSISVPFEHPVTSLSISPLGTDAVLAAKRGLYIIDLERPFQQPKMFQHVSKWDVADVYWNPHLVRSNWIASTSNQKALVWNIERCNSGASPVEFVLNKHLRAISDIHWSPFFPDLLASCSYDAYVHLWDLRTKPDKPSISFCGWNAGASQVKFNRVNEHLLASSHDTDIRIWDTRKGSAPVTLITAHMTKIYGIDWSISQENEILSCSQDKLVKIWHINQSRTCQATIETSSPCWRARYTPFGNGIVTMPQRKDNNLYLWNRDNTRAPIYTFTGHKDVPTEFVWRYNRDSSFHHVDQDFQLVTWSKDMHLRLWPISGDLVKAVSPEKPEDKLTLDPIQIRGKLGKSLFQAKRTHSEPQLYSSEAIDAPLDHASVSPGGYPISEQDFSSHMMQIEKELVQVSLKYPGVYIDKSQLRSSRQCTIRLDRSLDPSKLTGNKSPNMIFQVDVTFPERYPDESPVFELKKTSMISMINRTYLKNKIQQIGTTFAAKKIPCISELVNYLLGNTKNEIPIPYAAGDSDEEPITPTIKRSTTPEGLIDAGLSTSSSSDDDDELMPLGPRVKPKKTFGKTNNNVPFPVLCGARFSPSGDLVYFFSPIPHPSLSKFSQSGIAAKQNVQSANLYTTQPKNYPLYESYRNFVLSKYPRMYIGNSMSSYDGQNQIDIKLKDDKPKDRKLDYWLDDEELDDDRPIFSRSKLSLIQPPNENPTDFLARLYKYIKLSKPTQIISVESRRPSIPDKVQRLSSLVIPHNSTIPDSTVSAMPEGAHTIPIQRSNSVGDISGSKPIKQSFDPDTDLGIPFMENGNLPLNGDYEMVRQSFDLEPPEHILNMISNNTQKKHKRIVSDTHAAESKLQNSNPSFSKDNVQAELPASQPADEHIGYGTIIYVRKMEYLLPISQYLAKNYIFRNINKKLISKHNKQISRDYRRPDLVQIWNTIDIILEFISFDSGLAKQEEIILGQILNYLDRFMSELNNQEIKPVTRKMQMDSLTSSLAFASKPSQLQLVSVDYPKERKSKLASSLNRPLSISNTATEKKTKFSVVRTSSTLTHSRLPKRLLPDKLFAKYSNHIHSYANYLYNLGLLEQRTQLLVTTKTFGSDLGDQISNYY